MGRSRSDDQPSSEEPFWCPHRGLYIRLATKSVHGSSEECTGWTGITFSHQKAKKLLNTARVRQKDPAANLNKLSLTMDGTTEASTKIITTIN